MLNRRKSLTISVNLFHRCFRTKSGHGSDLISRKYTGEDGKEGQMRLFKSMGQHLLTNQRVLDSIVRTSEIKPEDTVLEIGPGTGNLTLKLLEAAQKVVAVEIDERMVEILRKRVAERGLLDRLNIISDDALKTDFPEFNLVVANIPYNISSPLLAKLFYGEISNPFRSATLLLQKEFARRLLAKPGDSEYNRLAVNMKLVAEVEFIMDVSKRDFVPNPKFDSSVVKIYPKTDIPNVNLKEWLEFTRTCFNKKNKTLGAVLKQKKKLKELMKLSKGGAFCEDSKEECLDDGEEEYTGEEGSVDLSLGDGTSSNLFREKVVSILESGGFLDKRPSKLCNDDLLRLLSQFNREGIYFHDRSSSNIAFDAAFDDNASFSWCDNH